MNFINRALKNVTRKMSKSLLLGLTFFLIGNFVIVGLGISSAADNAKIMTRQKMRAVVEYTIDHEQMWKDTENLTEEEQVEFNENNQVEITLDKILEIQKDSRVKVVNAIGNHQMYSKNFDSVLVGNEENNNSGGSYFETDEFGNTVEVVYVEPNISVKTNSFDNMIEFEDGIYKLVEGRMYTQEDIDNQSAVCLITDKLAEANNLSIGDTVTLETMELRSLEYYEGTTVEDITIEMEIIGIFDNSEELDPSDPNYDWMAPHMSPDNIILTTESFINSSQLKLAILSFESGKLNYPDEPYYQDEENRPTIEKMSYKNNIIILLNDPLDVDSFVEEYTATSDSKYLVFDANNETFLKLSKPLDTLSLFSNIIIWLVIINAIVIITLVTALTLKTREYEIGVLLSLGVSKTKVVAQFFVELAIIAVIGFTLAVMSGSMIASSVGNAVLDFQVATSDVEVEDDNNYYYGETDYFTEVSLEDITSKYEVTISPWIIAQIYVAGLGMVLISILIPSLMIMRFNPKKILLNTN